MTTFSVRGQTMYVRRFELHVVAGPDVGERAVSAGDELTVGTADGVGLRLTDAAVSRHHCVLRATAHGLEVADLGSTNGTFVGECEVARAYVTSGMRLRVGQTTVGITILDDEIAQALAEDATYGRIAGASPAMRRLYPRIEQFAQRDAPVLIRGEPGAGKTLVAEAVHLASPRAHRPLVVFDCRGLPRAEAEAVLAGDANAFTEAVDGSVLVEEIGELPLDLQSTLLRLLEASPARVLATTSRDLRVDVNARRFRAELYYRLDVLHLDVPPLREREGDVALLAARFWRSVRNEEVPAALVADLVSQPWPGNVSELRNAVERAAYAGWSAPAEPPRLSYGEAKERATREWERHWVAGLLAEHDHNLSRAARAARMGRSNLRQLCQRYGLRPKPDE